MCVSEVGKCGQVWATSAKHWPAHEFQPSHTPKRLHPDALLFTASVTKIVGLCAVL